MTMFVVLSSWLQAIVRVQPVQMTANPQTKPIDLGCESASRLLPSTPQSPFIVIAQSESSSLAQQLGVHH